MISHKNLDFQKIWHQDCSPYANNTWKLSGDPAPYMNYLDEFLSSILFPYCLSYTVAKYLYLSVSPSLSQV